MIDKDKIILMSQLALLDNDPEMPHNRRITSKYCKDFVYVANLFTQLSIAVVVIIFIATHLLWQIQSGMNLPTNLDEIIYTFIIPYGSLAFGSIIFYTIISTLVYKKIYRKAQLKTDKYDALVNELKNLSIQEEISNEKNTFRY
ncbi:hypothetical protein [Candidatus Epulonipiscium viviparus]|uniref:hypothetical protein n=1 Tax=Candidatus Epulonipiscium viviparus TaxID=420336 RepID=UPI00016BFF0F|nr:hypothetical protein [Candidatus Epulopiscium viviparus]